MNIKSLMKIRTKESLSKFIQILKDTSVETDISLNEILKVSNSGYKNLSYVNSVVMGDFLYCHWLRYGDEGTGYGLVCVDLVQNAIVEVCKPMYTSFTFVGAFIVLAKRMDLSEDLYNRENLIVEKADRLDILTMGILSFIQVDVSFSQKSLVCINYYTPIPEVYAPKSLNTFTSWFKARVKEYMLDGVFDELVPSDIPRVYYEVVNTIFKNSSFVPLEVKTNLED